MTFTNGQKKIFGALIIIIVAPVLLLIAAVLIEQLVRGETTEAGTIYSFLFTIGLCAFPLQFGIKLWRAGTVKPDYVIDRASDIAFRFTVKIPQNEYVRLLFAITYRKPTVLYITFLAVGMIGFYFLDTDMTFYILFFCLLGAYLPIGIYRNAVSTYKSTKALHESVTYEITSSFISMNGESFNSTLHWKTLYRVREIKGWFLLYTTRSTALIIPKKVFNSNEEINTFRNLAFSSVQPSR